MPESPEYDLLITADDSNMQIDDIEYTVEYISAVRIVGAASSIFNQMGWFRVRCWRWWELATCWSWMCWKVGRVFGKDLFVNATEVHETI